MTLAYHDKSQAFDIDNLAYTLRSRNGVSAMSDTEGTCTFNSSKSASPKSVCAAHMAPFLLSQCYWLDMREAKKDSGCGATGQGILLHCCHVIKRLHFCILSKERNFPNGFCVTFVPTGLG